jgi:hypothetical protein
MSDKVFNIIIKLVKQGGADKETIKGLIDIKNTMAAGVAVVGGFTAAYYALDKGLDATVGKLVTLTGEVEKFKNQTGMSAEDSSRMLEVMKDLEISAGDVETAFKFAEKNGFQPTIASLEAMQAQYQALNPGVERTQFLMKEFGKSGLSLQKFFETGDVAQRLEEVNKNLIISDDTITSVQEYKDRLDTIGDTWEGLKLHAGVLTLPIVLKLISDAAQIAGASDVVNGFKTVNAQLISTSKNWADYKTKEQAYLDQHPEVVHALMSEGINLHSIGAAIYSDTEATFGNIYAKAKLISILDAESDKLDTVHAHMMDAATATEDLAASEADLQKQISDQTSWEEVFTGLTSVADRTKKEFDTLGPMIQGLGAEGAMVWEGFLVATGKISPAAAYEFVKIQETFQTVKRMVEAGLAVNVIVNWIMSQQGQPVGNNPYNQGGGGVSGGGGGAGAGWVRLGTRNGPGTGSVWKNNTTGEVHFGATDTGWAQGGSFVVPPGYPNDSFPMRVQSGERVDVTPAGAMSGVNDQAQILAELRAIRSALDNVTLSARASRDLADTLQHAMAKLL